MAFIMTVALSSGFVFSQAEAKTLTVAELMEKFPNGKYWNHGSGANNPDGWTNSPCAHHNSCNWNGSCGCNSFDNAIQCWGFVLKLAYDAYGVSARKRAKSYSFDGLKAGDILVYNGYYGSEHYLFVTAIKDGYVYFGDCNGVGVSRGCEIRWGKKSVSELKSKFLYTLSAPYELESAVEEESPSFIEGVYTVHTSDTSNIPLNVRQSPTTASEIVGQLENGTVVSVTEVNGSWGKITYDGITGWIYLEYTRTDAPEICTVSVRTEKIDLSEQLDIEFSSDANVEYVVNVKVKNSVESLEVFNSVVKENKLSLEVSLGGTYQIDVTARNSAGSVAAKTVYVTVDYCPGVYIVTSTGSTLNIRSAATTDSNIVGSLPNAASVSVTEVNSIWGKVSYDSVTGWIYLDYTEYDTVSEVIEPVYYPGDINGDESTDIEDAMILFYHIAGKEKLTDEQVALSDFNGDGSVDIADAMLLFYFIAGKVDELITAVE